jgi:hypothetical protein
MMAGDGRAAPVTFDDLRIWLGFFLAASWFTLPGAFLLWTIEKALSPKLASAPRLDAAMMTIGALAGAAMLGGLSVGTDGALGFALLGGFYGLTTAVIFVLIQRSLAFRKSRH